jgi:hypothetical protein
MQRTGNSGQTDCTSNALTIHIAKDKSTDITTISSPLHKRMKTSVPVSIPGIFNISEPWFCVERFITSSNRTKVVFICSNNNGTDDFQCFWSSFAFVYN